MPSDDVTLPEPAVDDLRERSRPGRDGSPTGRFRRRRTRERPPKSPTRNAVEWVAVMVGAVVVALVVRTFLFQTFYIPSQSMTHTLEKDDRVIVNKLAYKLGDVERGDVVVFERPKNDPSIKEKDLIKRVIGLPGDRVSITGGTVKIDGRVLDEPYTSGLPTDASVTCGPGEVTGLATAEGLKIPEGTVLVLGDNRLESHDGRCFGPIDQDTIVGRAFALIWPLSRTGGL